MNTKKFNIRKNSISQCYVADKDGVITTNKLHTDSNISYKKGDWICNDPNNEDDIWPISQTLHQNYTKVD